MNTSLNNFQEKRLEFYQLLVGPGPQDMTGLVPLAKFLKRLAESPLLKNKPKA